MVSGTACPVSSRQQCLFHCCHGGCEMCKLAIRRNSMSGKGLTAGSWKWDQTVCCCLILVFLLGLTACASGNHDAASAKDVIRVREGVKSLPASVGFPLSCMSRKAQFTIRLPASREGDGYKWICLIPETSGITLLSRKFIPPRWDEKQQISFSGYEEFLFLAAQ